MKLGGEIGGNMLPAGWHKVEVEGLSCEYSQKGTQIIKIDLLEVEGSRTIKKDFYVTEKSYVFLARFIKDAGVSDEQREQMDTDDDSSMDPLMGRKLWVLVDWEKNNKSNKWYRSVTAHAPDGERPHGGPKYLDNPGMSSAGTKPPVQPGQEDALPFPDDTDDVPFL